MRRSQSNNDHEEASESLSIASELLSLPDAAAASPRRCAGRAGCRDRHRRRRICATVHTGSHPNAVCRTGRRRTSAAATGSLPPAPYTKWKGSSGNSTEPRAAGVPAAK
eukprot:3162563-Pleurochrysis_carterae.AAC.3